MKIIVSHDVDHLYPIDHVFRDLIFPKLWVRSFLHFLKSRITFKTFLFRLISIFDKRLNRIPEIIEYDKNHGVKSTFFFGMNNALGLSYHKNEAAKWIHTVIENGFHIGVHGINFQDFNIINEEFESFKQLSKLHKFGIRTHYVRYDNDTFSKFAKCGYTFDTSEFNKNEIDIKKAYKINEMWEFPLHIMDVYTMKDNLEKAKAQTIEILEMANNKKIEYFTFLFHDYQYNDKTYPNDKRYYEWFIDYCIMKKYKFVSYDEAINELNNYGK